MMLELSSRLEKTLSWIADRSIIGAMVALGSVGLITAPAAVAAGAAASRAGSLRDAVPTFVRAYRASFRPGLLPGSLALFLIVSATGSITLVAPRVDGLERALFLVSALLTVVADTTVLLFAAAVLDAGQQLTVARILRLAILSPRTALIGCALAAAIMAALLVMPILAFPIAGVLAKVTATIVPRTMSRLQHTSV